MLRTLSILATSFMVALSGAMMPGPLLVMTIARAAEDGFWTAPLLMLGHAIAELATVILLIKGAGKYLKRPRVFGIIAVLGAAFLLYMAYGTFTYGGAGPSLTGTGTSAAGTRLPDPVSGMVLSLTNPYWTMWWVTIGTTYLALAQQRGTTGIAAFYSGHILADVGWYCAVAFLVATGSQFLTGEIYHDVLMALSFALAGMGVYFLVSGVRSLRKKTA
ncbi:MAG: LysE family transporter [Chloroflexota bacterium]